jgi:hypothetical protein
MSVTLLAVHTAFSYTLILIVWLETFILNVGMGERGRKKPHTHESNTIYFLLSLFQLNQPFKFFRVGFDSNEKRKTFFLIE